MSSCISYLSSIIQEYDDFFKKVRELAFKAAKKLGVDDWIEGMAYLQRLNKKNGRSYVVIELYRESGSRRKISLGPIDKFSKQSLYKILKNRFGLEKDEVDALLIMRFLKDYRRRLANLEYHVNRAIEIANELELRTNEYIDQLINQVKNEVMVW